MANAVNVESRAAVIFMDAWSTEYFVVTPGGAFFVREGERCRFAHKSFWELFFARHLASALAPAAVGRVLDTLPITRAAIAFFAEVLSRQGDPFSAPAVEAIRSWLLGERAPHLGGADRAWQNS
jgi:hypothetical protein